MEVVPMPEEATQATVEQSAAGSESSSTSTSGKSYSADEVERIIAQRVNKAKSAYADYDDLKARAARADELEQSQQTETDKLRSKAEREAEKRAASEDKAKQATERAERALMRAAVVAAAAKRGAADPGDVFTLLDKSSLAIDDDDTVTGVDDAVDALLKAKPHLLKRAGGFDGGRQGGASTSSPSMNDLIREQAGFSGR